MASVGPCTKSACPQRGRPGRGCRLRPGLVIALEPMLIPGGVDDYVTARDGWTLRSANGRRAAHSEHTIAILEDGPLISPLPTTRAAPARTPDPRGPSCDGAGNSRKVESDGACRADGARMTTQMVTSPTGSSLQRLAERSWERTAAGSQLFYEISTGPGSSSPSGPSGWPAACGRPAAARRAGGHLHGQLPRGQRQLSRRLAGGRGGHARAVPAQRGRAAACAERQRRCWPSPRRSSCPR